MQSCHQAAWAPTQSVTIELIFGCLQDNGPIYTKLVFIKICDYLEVPGPRRELYLYLDIKKKKYHSLLQNIRLMAFQKDLMLFFFQVYLNLWVWLAKVKVSAIWGNVVWPVFKPKMTSYKEGFCRAMRSQSKDGSWGFSSSPLCFVACGFRDEH